MLQVHITDNQKYIAKDQIAVRLPKDQFLVFDIDSDYFLDEITANPPVEEDMVDYIVCHREYDDILKTFIRKGLTTLSYIFYMTTNSINETVKRLNSLELEEVVWSMICNDVADKFMTLYEEQ